MQNKSSEKQLDCCHNTLRKIKNETGISTNSHPWISMTVKKNWLSKNNFKISQLIITISLLMLRKNS